MLASRRLVLSVAAAALGLVLVSGTPYSRAAMSGHKTLVPSPGEARANPPHVVETFEVRSANTLETVEVRYVDGVLDPASKQQLDHLMRCLRTEGAKPVDPRLVEMMRDIAREVGGRLDVVSGYRAPRSWHEHNFHNRAEAVDLRVPGMSARKLRSIARKVGIKGIGWYPTTNMIHIDTRDDEYFWIDWSGPNQIGREVRIH